MVYNELLCWKNKTTRIINGMVQIIRTVFGHKNCGDMIWNMSSLWIFIAMLYLPTVSSSIHQQEMKLRLGCSSKSDDIPNVNEFN